VLTIRLLFFFDVQLIDCLNWRVNNNIDDVLTVRSLLAIFLNE
jgi:hypothetical protein